MTATTDTIFALSSGRPPAAVAVVRLSGPQARDAILALAGRMPAPRYAMLARLHDRTAGATEPLDDALVLWFPGPRSETGEDMAEFQLHGGRAVVAGVLAALARIPGCRPAEAGEFTRRSFINGKLDLTRVEGLADLIGAETAAQRRHALRQLHGLIGDRTERWRGRLIEALVLAEATIDFPDEGGVPQDLLAPCLAIAAELETELRAELGNRHGERLRDGLIIALAGPVNVGKSTILNRLAKRPAAIVSPYAGTTRDVIEVHLDLDGYPVTVLDTAGIRNTTDPIEQEGVLRARQRSAEADLVLWVLDAADRFEPPPGELAKKPERVWIVINKCDRLDGSRKEIDVENNRTGLQRTFALSALTGDGFDTLLRALAVYANDFFRGGELAMITRERHRGLLAACADSLARAGAETASGREEIIAEELRLAARSLGRLTGRIDVEDVLDGIFRDFCIGK